MNSGSTLAELGVAPCGRPHLDRPPRLVGAVGWRVFSREWFQPPSAGVQPSVWKLDYCAPHGHATHRLVRPSLSFFVSSAAIVRETLFTSVLVTGPVGLYGHSAVYHEQTDAIYVFGGYRFHVETVEPSGELYSLFYPNLTWSLLVPSQGNKV